MSSLNFSRNYRLKSKKAISSLFEHGSKLTNYPVFLLYQQEMERVDPRIRIAISVPKRKLRRAVDRNRMKRIIREAVKNSEVAVVDTLKKENKSYNLMFIYQDDKLNSLSMIEEKINILLKPFNISGERIAQKQNPSRNEQVQIIF